MARDAHVKNSTFLFKRAKPVEEDQFCATLRNRRTHCDPFDTISGVRPLALIIDESLVLRSKILWQYGLEPLPYLPIGEINSRHPLSYSYSNERAIVS